MGFLALFFFFSHSVFTHSVLIKGDSEKMPGITLKELQESYSRDQTGLTRQQFREMEGILYNYPFLGHAISDALQKLEEIRFDLIANPGTSIIANEGGGKTNKISDKTGETVIKFDEDPRACAVKRNLSYYRRAQVTVNKILDFFEQHIPEHALFIRRKYFEMATNDELVDELNISPRGYYRRREEVLYYCGKVAGWLL